MARCEAAVVAYYTTLRLCATSCCRLSAQQQHHLCANQNHRWLLLLRCCPGCKAAAAALVDFNIYSGEKVKNGLHLSSHHQQNTFDDSFFGPFYSVFQLISRTLCFKNVLFFLGKLIIGVEGRGMEYCSFSIPWERVLLVVIIYSENSSSSTQCIYLHFFRHDLNATLAFGR